MAEKDPFLDAANQMHEDPFLAAAYAPTDPTNQLKEAPASVQKLKGTPVAPGMPASVSELGSKDPAKGVMDVTTGVPEAALAGFQALGSPFATAYIAPFKALQGSDKPFVDAKKMVDEAMYQPKSEMAQFVTRAVGYPIELVSDAIKYWGQKAGMDENAITATETAVLIATFGAPKVMEMYKKRGLISTKGEFGKAATIEDLEEMISKGKYTAADMESMERLAARLPKMPEGIEVDASFFPKTEDVPRGTEDLEARQGELKDQADSLAFERDQAKKKGDLVEFKRLNGEIEKINTERDRLAGDPRTLDKQPLDLGPDPPVDEYGGRDPREKSYVPSPEEAEAMKPSKEAESFESSRKKYEGKYLSNDGTMKDWKDLTADEKKDYYPPKERIESDAVTADAAYSKGMGTAPYKKAGFFRRVADSLTLDPFPRMVRAAQSVADSASRVAAAFGQGDRIVNTKVKKVFPEAADHLPKYVAEKAAAGKPMSPAESKLYRQAVRRNKFGKLLIQDRLVAIYKRSIDRAKTARETMEALHARLTGIQDELRRQSSGRTGQAAPHLLPDLKGKAREISEAIAQAKKDHEYFTKKAMDIERVHDIKEYETHVLSNMDQFADELATWKKEINTYLDDLYKEGKGVEEGEFSDADNTGFYTGARVNLVHADMSAPDWEYAVKNKADQITAGSRGKDSGASVMKDPWDREAKGTGSYTASLYGMLRPVVSRRYQAVTKLRFYSELEKAGLGKIVSPGESVPAELKGRPLIELQSAIGLPETDPATGKTKTVLKKLYVTEDIASEVKQLLLPDKDIAELPGARYATDLQLGQLATDSVTHGMNIFTLGNKFFDNQFSRVSSKLPLLSPAESANRFFKTYRKVLSPDLAMTERISEMGENGLLRDGYHVSKLAELVAKITGKPGAIEHPGNPFASGQVLLKMDTAMRVLLDDHYKMMVKEGKLVDSPTNRRNFVLQVGNYNARMMQPWMAFLRKSAVSPYVVAGANYTRNAVRFLTGHPGGETTGIGAGASLRAEHLIKPMIFGTLLPAMWNQYKTGHWQGRPGTPPGHLDMGGPVDEDGKFDTFNLMVGTPMDRGLRIVGGQAIWEGAASGKTPVQIAEQVLTDAGRSVKHVGLGPGPEALAVALTGHDTDFTGRPHLRYQKSVPGKILERPRAALQVTSPQAYTLLTGEGAEHKGPVGKMASEAESPVAKRALNLLDTVTQTPLRAAGIRKSHKARTAAEQEMVDRSVHLDEAAEPGTIESKEAIKKAVNMAKTDEPGAIAFLQDKIDKGIVTEGQATRAWKDRNLDKLVKDFKRFSVEKTQTEKGSFAALEIYKLMNEEEKAKVTEILNQKISRVWKKADATKQRELLKAWHSILPEVFASGEE